MSRAKAKAKKNKAQGHLSKKENGGKGEGRGGDGPRKPRPRRDPGESTGEDGAAEAPQPQQNRGSIFKTLMPAVLVSIGGIAALSWSYRSVDGECSADERNGQGRPTRGAPDDDYFYAWPTPASEDSLMNALFPDAVRLRSAWEAHPLLSRVSFGPRQSEDSPEQIPTVLHNRSSLSSLPRTVSGSGDEDGDPLLSLFSIDDTPAVLSQPMKHGDDYKLVKKIILPPEHEEAGEEYMGMLPNPRYSVEEVIQHFHYGAFSLVINRMERRWNSIARMARALEEELGVMQVGVNLYLTPEVDLEGEGDAHNTDVRQGFEAHWDWMDVIVIQISGRKRWSVAQVPSVYLSGKDSKRKPSNAELEKLRRYPEFTLCPGDVLYIPRGHVHNASTVAFDLLESGSEGTKALLDSCPAYPKDSESGVLLTSLLDGPSLHLTFGLLQSNDATIETLLHHAIDVYFASTGGKNARDRVAVPANTCPSHDQSAMDYDLEWKSILHHSLAEVARRDHWCDSIISNRDPLTENQEKCDGTVILRQSVPFLLLSGNRVKETPGEKSTQQYSNLKQSCLLALGTFLSSASIPKTMNFIESLLLRPPSNDGLTFHYPRYDKTDKILCPDAMKSLSVDYFLQLLRSFDKFTRDHFDTVLEDMNLWGKGIRKDKRRRQESGLELVGQGGISDWQTNRNYIT